MDDLSKENIKGVVLALLSSLFIGASFIIKKKGLRRAAAASGVRAGVGGHSYLLEPLWWLGMITMIVGEAANFIAYAFAPAVLVTPLGALSIIISAVLAHFILKEKLCKLGVLGCVMCIAGSVIIVIHAPQEYPITSVLEIWNMATQPVFLLYVGSVIVLVFILVFHFSPRCGHTNVLVYTGICSLMGSLSVMSVKALGTSLKLTFEGKNQLIYPETWFFMLVVATCVITQLNYLNKKQLWCFKSRKFAIIIEKFGNVTTLTHRVPDSDFLSRSSRQLLERIFQIKRFLCEMKSLVDLPLREVALDTFNTAIVSPIYYVMFTTLTILASVIMFKDWDGQSGGDIISEICGFIVVLSGTILLHTTREFERSSSFRGGGNNYLPVSPSLSTRLCSGNGESFKHDEENDLPSEDICLRIQESY